MYYQEIWMTQAFYDQAEEEEEEEEEEEKLEEKLWQASKV